MPGEMVGSAYAKISLDSSELERGLSAAESRFSSSVGKMEGMGSKIGSALKTGIAAAGVAAAGVATVGVKSYMDIERAAADAASKMDLSAIAKQSGITTAQAFDSVKQHVMDLSDELGQLNTNAFDPTQIAEACADLAASGFDVASASAEDLRDVLALATATNYDLADSSRIGMSTLNQFGFGVEKLGHVSDVYAMAAGKSAAGMTDFDYAMQQAGPVAKGVGMSFEELTARISKLADSGYGGEKAGTALRTAFMALTSPTQTQIDTLTRLGLTFDDVDPRVHTFSESMDLLLAHGADIYDFGEIYGKEGAAIVYSTAQQNTEVKKLTSELKNCDGAASDMAKNMLNTVAGSFDAAKGAASSLAYMIGGKLAPTVKSALDWFSAEAAPTIREFLDAIFDADWDKVGEMLTDQFDNAVDFIKDIDWRGVAESAGRAIKGGIEFGIAGLQKIGSTIINWIKTADWPSISTYIKTSVEKGIDALSTIGNRILGWLMGVNWSSVGTTIKNAVTSGINALSGIGNTILGWITNVEWSSVGATIGNAVTSGINALSGIGNTIAGWINSVDWSSVGQTIGNAIINGINILKNIGSTIAGWLKEGDYSGAGSLAAAAFKAKMEALSGIGKTIADYIKNTDWKAVGDTAGKAISAGIEAVKTYADGIKKNFAAWVAAGNAKQLGIDIGNAIANAVKDVVNLGKWIADSLQNKGGGDLIKGAIQTGIEWLAIGSAAVADFIVGFANGLAPLAKSIANAAMDGVAWALGYIPGVGDELAEEIKSHKFEINWEAPEAGESTFYTPPGYTAPSGGYGGGYTSPAPTPEGVTTKTGLTGETIYSTGAAGPYGYAMRGNMYVLMEGGKQSTKGYEWKTAEQAAAAVARLNNSTYSLQRAVESYEKYGTTMGGWYGEADKFVGNVGALNDTLKYSSISLFNSSELFKTAAEMSAATELSAETQGAGIETSAAQAAAGITTAAAKESQVILIDGSRTAANTLNTASRVASNFTTQGAQAVRIGLTQSGQEIAVIGRVAQENFAAAGGQWVNQTVVGAAQAASIATTAASQAGSATTTAAQSAKSSIMGGAERAKSIQVSGASTAAGKIETSGDSFSSKVTGAADAAATSISKAADWLSIVAEVNAGVTKMSRAGYGGGGGNISANGSTINFNDCLFDEFTDTCTGVAVNALKYTDPSGGVHYINPMTYQQTGGVAPYLTGSATGSSRGSSSVGGNYLTSQGYQLPAIFRARGGLVKSPELAVLADKGAELVLPANITSTIVNLANMGFASMKGLSGQGITIYPADIILDGKKVGRVVFSEGTNRMRSKGLSLR